MIPKPSMRPDLPTGTVTFLFTDVEGSTQAAARRSGTRRTKTRSPSTGGSASGLPGHTTASR